MKKAQISLSCDLTSPEERQHRIDLRKSLVPHLMNTDYNASESNLTFSKSQTTLKQIEDFISAERKCCTFLKFDIVEHEKYFELTVAGPEGSEGLVKEIFAESRNTSGCGCSTASSQSKSSKKNNKFKAYVGGFFSLCVICCAAPYILVTLGFMSVSTGAYFGRTLEALLLAGVLMLLGYFTLRHLRAKQAG